MLSWTIGPGLTFPIHDEFLLLFIFKMISVAVVVVVVVVVVVTAGVDHRIDSRNDDQLNSIDSERICGRGIMGAMGLNLNSNYKSGTEALRPSGHEPIS